MAISLALGSSTIPFLNTLPQPSDARRHSSMSQEGDVPEFGAAELLVCLQTLRPRKAVPPGCPPAEIWQLQPDASADFLQRVLHAACAKGRQLPCSLTDCALILMPKPGKPTRLPKDLRPLGLQDPAAKLLASAVKSRVQAAVLPWLMQHPQFAYCKGKSLDEAITRAADHCKSVSDELKSAQVSVQARRQGKRPQACFGGATLSIDLSRAFDQLPRWALVASLLHAKVEASLIDIIVAIHEGCTYHVTHAQHSGSFPLQVGVRQGCTLAPLLFCIYSCWISDLMDARLGFHWSSKHHTAFADDNLVQWLIRSEQDLGIMCVHIRTLFGLLGEVGMDVNVLKSGLLIRVQGNVAKAWLRRHVRVAKAGQFHLCWHAAATH